MILWDESGEFDRRIIFLSTDMNRVFLNIEVQDCGIDEKIYSMPISSNPQYIAWLIKNHKSVTNLYHLKIWYEEQYKSKYIKEIDEYYFKLTKTIEG
jgi:hypothetical protein